MSDIHTIDLLFQDVPGVIASSVFDTGDGLALVDTGPATTLPTLEDSLSGLGASLRDLRHLLLTHIHFDHAGAAGILLERLPRARVYVHEQGAAHLARPEKLVASATQIYGDQMDRLWGDMRPVDPERMTVLEGGGLKIGQSDLHVLYTPGHAVHHVSYHVGDDLFVGDVGGIRLADPQTPRAPTPPPDINLEAWRDSIEKLRGLDARTLHLTHFGCYANTPAHWDGLLATMDVDAERVRAPLLEGKDFAWIAAQFAGQLFADLASEDPALPGRYEFACPPWMSVQGLMRYWQRRAARHTGESGGGAQ